jgi:rhodanese-related sulfurtransferase
MAVRGAAQPRTAVTLDGSAPRKETVIPAVRTAATTRARRIAVLLVVAGFLLSACSTDDGAASATTPRDDASAVAVDPSAVRVVEPDEALDLIGGSGTTVIDVRTPEEYAAGHVTGARNIDVSADTFDDRVAELPRDGSYVVYCRTGSRSAEAAARMADLGFTGIADAGAFDDLVEAGASAETG